MECFKPPDPLIKYDLKHWKLWKQKFEIYMKASGKENEHEEVKIAILLNCMGDEAVIIYNIFERKKKTTLKKLIESYDAYFRPKQMVPFEAFRFHRLFQECDQSIENYISELQRQAKLCQFVCSKEGCNTSYEERMIHDRLLVGIYDKEVQAKLLLKSNVDLTELIEICKKENSRDMYFRFRDVGIMEESVHKDFEMGRKTKKNNFKAFNSANIDEIEAKQKENPVGTSKNKKSPKRQGNPIEKSPTPANEKDAKKEINYSLSNENHEYKEDIVVNQTTISDRSRSDKVGGSSMTRHGRDIQAAKENRDKPLQNTSRESSTDHQVRNKDSRKTITSKKNYNKNDDHQSSSEKNSSNWQQEFENVHSYTESSYTQNDSKVSTSEGYNSQTKPRKPNAYGEQWGSRKKDNSYASRDTPNQDYPNVAIKDDPNKDYRTNITDTSSKNKIGKNESYQRNSGNNANNWQHESVKSKSYVDSFDWKTNPRQSDVSRDQKGQYKRNDYTKNNNKQTRYRAQETTHENNQRDENWTTINSGGNNAISKQLDDEWEITNSINDHNRNDNKQNHWTAQGSTHKNQQLDEEWGIVSSDWNTDNKQNHWTAQGSTHKNQQIDQEWGFVRSDWNTDNKQSRYRAQESTRENKQLNNNWKIVSSGRDNSVSKQFDNSWENTSTSKKQSNWKTQESTHENQELVNSWGTLSTDGNYSVNNKVSDDWNDSENDHMLEETSNVDKNLKSSKFANAANDKCNNKKYSKDNYVVSKTSSRKSDTFSTDRSEKTVGSRYSDEGNRSSRFSDSSSRSRRSTELDDPEYREFKQHQEYEKYVKVKELEQDLFEVSEDYSLGHCVAADMRMGSGIAVLFKKKFNNLGQLLSQNQKSGGLALLENETPVGKRYIYYLVTKSLSHEKPVYTDFWLSLKKMRDHIQENEVKKLAIPKIGCGLDRLEWTRVKSMIEFLFQNVDVEIIVCNLQQAEESTPQKDRTCRVVFDDKPVAKIDDGTIIIYFSTERGDIEEDVYELDKEFNFLNQFKKSNKMLGDVIRFDHKTKYYILYGCIVRKTPNDLFDFKSFEKCLLQINKNNRKDLMVYVAYQVIFDRNDSYVNEKIITMLRNVLRNVDVYVCKSNRIGDISVEE